MPDCIIAQIELPDGAGLRPCKCREMPRMRHQGVNKTMHMRDLGLEELWLVH